MTERFPVETLTPASERWRLVGTTVSGGVNLIGFPGLARTDGGGLWMCWMDDIELVTPAEIKAARALELRLDEGVTTLEVPAFEGPTGVVPPGAGWRAIYAAAAPAALRATTLTITRSVGMALTGGEKFTIVHPTMGARIYGVAEVTATDGPDQTIKIRPPLREAVTDEAIDFNDPRCRMRLANPEEFLGALDASHESSAKAIWVESFDAA